MDDSWDDTLRMAKDTILKYTKVFAETVVHVYEPQYLQAPNTEDTARLLPMHEAKKLVWDAGSVDCIQ